MMKQLLRVLFVPAAALMFFACANAPVQPAGKTTAVPGKVPIRYLWTEADAKAGARGFHVYRSSTPGGGFVRLTSNPIEPRNPRPGQVIDLFTDREVALGQTQYYYVERVDRDGRARKVTSVTAAQAILPLQAEDAAEKARQPEPDKS